MTDRAAEVDALREQVRQFKAVLGGGLRWPVEWRLTRVQTIILGVLVKRRLANRETLVVTLYGDRADPPSDKCVDVHIYHLRRKLKPRGFVIETHVGVGWRLPDAERARLEQLADQTRREQ